MVEVVKELHLQDSLHLAVALLDRFLSCTRVGVHGKEHQRSARPAVCITSFTAATPGAGSVVVKSHSEVVGSCNCRAVQGVAGNKLVACLEHRVCYAHCVMQYQCLVVSVLAKHNLLLHSCRLCQAKHCSC